MQALQEARDAELAAQLAAQERDQAAAGGRAQRLIGDDGEELDEVPLMQWIGVEGPLSHFGVHLLSVLLFSCIFLWSALCIPLNLGRTFLYASVLAPRVR